MNHKWTAALAAAVLAGSAGAARGQAMEGGGYRAGRFDLGVYAGGSLTSKWFDSRTVTLDGSATGSDNGDSQGYAPGLGGAFGAFATYWMSPSLGVRAHGGYLPMRLPFASTGFFDTSPDGGPGGRSAYVMNTYVYDLDLVLRPFPWHSVYLFAGGGGLTVNLAGTNRPQCEGTLLARGACLSFEPKQATVGQGTAGLGMDLFWLAHSLALFGELAANVYDSPVHVGDDFVGPVTALRGSTVRVADDRTAVTGRAVLGLKLVLGDILPRPVMAPPPPEVIPPAPEPMAPPPPAPAMQSLAVCVVQGGRLATVTAEMNPATGDTTVDGRSFREAYPAGAEYASGAGWFINSEPVTFGGRRYVKYGLPRVLGASDVASVGSYQGVAVFAETSADRMRPEVIYLPVRPGCELQPYQVEVKAGAVRG